MMAQLSISFREVPLCCAMSCETFLYCYFKNKFHEIPQNVDKSMVYQSVCLEKAPHTNTVFTSRRCSKVISHCDRHHKRKIETHLSIYIRIGNLASDDSRDVSCQSLLFWLLSCSVQGDTDNCNKSQCPRDCLQGREELQPP